MHRLRAKHACSLSLLLILSLAAGPLWAQWAWRDAGGTIQYSDAPPPASVPKDRILKQPRVSSETTPVPAEKPADTASSSEGSTPSWVNQNAEFVKRRQQRLEQEQKEKQARQAAAEKKRQCLLARDNLAMYEGATPILYRAKDGERRYMTAGERAAEAKKMRDFLKDCR